MNACRGRGALEGSCCGRFGLHSLCGSLSFCGNASRGFLQYLGEDPLRQPNEARDKSRGFNRGAHPHRQCQPFSFQPTVSAICALTTQRINDRWDEVDGAAECTILISFQLEATSWKVSNQLNASAVPVPELQLALSVLSINAKPHAVSINAPPRHLVRSSTHDSASTEQIETTFCRGIKPLHLIFTNK